MALYFPDRSAQGLQFGDEGNSGIAPSGGALYFPDRTAPGLQFGNGTEPPEPPIPPTPPGAGDVSFFVNGPAIAVLQLLQPDLGYTGGMNIGGSNCPGIGVGVNRPYLRPSDWTLKDQDEAARTPQVGSSVGVSGIGQGSPTKSTLPLQVGVCAAAGDGTVEEEAGAFLTSLDTGWEGE